MPFNDYIKTLRTDGYDELFEAWCDKVFKKEYSGWFKWSSTSNGFELLTEENIDLYVKKYYRAEVLRRVKHLKHPPTKVEGGK